MSDLTTLAAAVGGIPGLVVEISTGKRVRIVEGKMVTEDQDRVTCFVGNASLEFSNVADALLAIKLHELLAGNGLLTVASLTPTLPVVEAIAAPAEGKPNRRRRKAAEAAGEPGTRPPPKPGLPGPPRPTLPTSQESISLAEADRQLAAEEQAAPAVAAAAASPMSSRFADRQDRPTATPRRTADPNRVNVATSPAVI